MNSNFAASLADVLASEGGLVDDPRDPGGRTDHGVTQREYDHYRTRHGLLLQDVAKVSTDELSSIYRGDYWNPVSGDALPAGVDYIVFDCAVNSGPFRAICILQQALGVNDDGDLGPATSAAISAADPAQLIDDFKEAHLAFLQKLRTWAYYGHGWGNRADAVASAAKAMIQ